MARNPRIFVMGEGIGVRGGNFRTTAGLFDKFGAERLCDTPICERGFVGLSCGAAMTGTRPVIDFMFVDFINDSYGEIVNQIAKMQYMSSGRLKMPVLLRGCIGVGHAAATHHSSNFTSVYTHIPGLRVVIPATPYDAKGLFLHALRCNDPVMFLEHRELMAIKGPVPEEPYEIEFGRASIPRVGGAATVVAMGLMLHRVLAVAEELAAKGIEIEVIDPRTASPLDVPTILQSVAKTGRLLVVDEAYGPCSLAAEIVAQVADAGFNDLDAPIKRLNGAFTPTPYSPPLEKVVVPQVDDIRRAILGHCWLSSVDIRRSCSPNLLTRRHFFEKHMSIEITIPRLGWSMEEGIFVRWLKGEGEWVNRAISSFCWKAKRQRRRSKRSTRGSCTSPRQPTAGRNGKGRPGDCAVRRRTKLAIDRRKAHRPPGKRRPAQWPRGAPARRSRRAGDSPGN